MSILHSASGPSRLRTVIVSATPREPTGSKILMLEPSAAAGALAVMVAKICTQPMHAQMHACRSWSYQHS